MARIQEHMQGWEPPDDVTMYTGDPIPREADFFADPPEGIGAVRGACTTLSVGDEPTAPGARLLMTLVVGALGVGLGLGIDYLASVESSFWWYCWPGVLGLAGLGITWFATTFSHTCTYVGDAGVARMECSGKRDQITLDETFLFRTATELRTTQTRHYRNGAYQKTDYAYTWTDVADQTRYVIQGTHHSEEGTPPATDLYHFATAAELAWSQSLLESFHRQIMTKGEVRFRIRLGGDSWVSVGEGFLRLCLKGQITERATEDIESVSIAEGMFTVKEVGAKVGWFSSRGVFTFEYENLANAQLFLFVLDKVVGIRVV